MAKKYASFIEIIVIADKPIIYRYRDNFELARYRHRDNDNSHPVIVIAIIKKIIVDNPVEKKATLKLGQGELELR